MAFYCKISYSGIVFLCKISYFTNSFECDFVVCKGNKVIQAIQVSYDISDEKTYKREKNGLLLAARQTKCDNKTERHHIAGFAA
jgi:predicted AAA+ superfamily ATPase